MHYKIIGWITLDENYEPKTKSGKKTRVWQTENMAKQYGTYAEPVYVERLSVDDV